MTEPVLVRSADNERYRRLLTLSNSSRERRKLKRTVIEGHKLLEAFLEMKTLQPSTVHDVFVNQSMLHDSLVLRLMSARPAIVLTDGLFKAASQLASPAGPIAIIETPSIELPEQFDQELVYLDRIQDPGNVGTILRTCAAAGVNNVVTSAGTAFCWAPKVLRSAMGGHFSLQIFEGVEPEQLQARLAPTLTQRAMLAPYACADSSMPQALHLADLRAPSAWLFGSEGSGLRSELVGQKTHQLTIAQDPAVESLNVGSAVAICLFEARRQRGQ